MKEIIENLGFVKHNETFSADYTSFVLERGDEILWLDWKINSNKIGIRNTSCYMGKNSSFPRFITPGYRTFFDGNCNSKEDLEYILKLITN